MAAPTTAIGAPDISWGGLGQTTLTDWIDTTPDLIWPTSVYTFGRMRHDLQLRAVLSAYVLPILRATWVLDPTGCRDEVVQHVADDLGIGVLGTDLHPGPARRRGIVWHRHLREALRSHLVFGHMPFERLYDVGAAKPGGTHLVALEPRNPWTIAEIKTGPGGAVTELAQNTQRDPIPASRLVWYVSEQEGANWAGISALRPAYGAWLLKHETWRVHATAIRRFGMGVPGVEAPPGATAAQVAQARDMASAMRAGDQSGMGVPAGFRPFLLGMSGGAPDALAFIHYLDQAMAKSALAGLIELGQTETGSRALGESFLDLFLLSLQSVADEVADTATSGHPNMPGIVTGLVDTNWGVDEPAPRVVCTDVGTNYEVTAEALSALTTCKALQPDEELDGWIRERWRLPQRKGPWVSPSQAPPPPGRGEAATPPPTPGPVAATRAHRRTPSRVRSAASAAVGLRRDLTAAEVRAGWQPLAHQAEWQHALDALVAAYTPVMRAQCGDLVNQVAASVEAGQPGRLAALASSAADGAAVLARHLGVMAETAAIRMVTEAAGQGVHIDLGVVRLPQEKLATISHVRATLAAAHYAQAAGTKAMQVVRAAVPRSLAQQATDAGQMIDDYLRGLSAGPLTDQLGAALSAAQHAGRVAVLEAAPESAGQASYTATELLDRNTCQPCKDEDGAEFGSLAEADAAYPNGGFLGCLGGLRCRGTVVAVWEPQSHPRDGGGQFAVVPGAHVRVTTGYHAGKTGHVVQVDGGNVKVRQAGGGEFLTGAHVVEPTGQPGIEVTAPAPAEPYLTEKTARPGMRVQIPGEPGQTGEIVRVERGPHSIPGAVVQYPRPTLQEGYAPHWVPLGQLKQARTASAWPLAAAFDPHEHPRDGHGRFSHGPATGKVARWEEDYAEPAPDTWVPPLRPAQGVKALTSRGRPDGDGTPGDPIDVEGDLDRALTLMADGKHVRLNQVDEVALLMDKVNDLAHRTENDNPKPVWNFGLLTVAGTNLFTAEHRGIPRIAMPQFSGRAEPGTEAARIAGGAGNFADLSTQFAAQLRKDKVTVRRRRVPVANLRATQSELNGAKVASFADAARSGNERALSALAEAIYVTRDHYVIDGHHRWAANMMLDSLDGVLGNDTFQNVIEIDLDIGAAIPYALKFAQDMGIATRGVAAALLAAAMRRLAGDAR